MNIVIIIDELRATKDEIDKLYIHVTNLQDSFGEGSHTLHIYIIFHGSEKKPDKHFSLKKQEGKLLNRVMKKSLLIHHF